MSHFSLDQLATYKLVIARGSFTGAAEVLRISQPAVSLQIRQLEQALQTRLIERSGRGIRPTAAGETFLAHCAHIENAVNTAVQSVAVYQQAISGQVTIGTGATTCIHLLPPVLQQLREEFPLLTVGVRTGNTSDILRAVEENRVDIGLVTMPASGRNLAISPLFNESFVAITAEGQPRQALPLIVFESGSSTRQRIDEWLVDNGEHAAPVMELGSIEAIKRMVRAGLGYSIVPDVAVQTEEDSLGLRVTPLQPPLQRTLALVMRQDKVVTRGMTEVLNSLKRRV
ncbi:LysR family transcriptional regulator [Kosakonia sp. ML.JS2a]|uniref:LysR family transcriptional regulator n=1 Tax=Kosakonia sp. ML.JS2a TaxID=2980557 RepID=UPI0021DAF550|nr:LysR family transcriptional regulator [Kosakonia sp. ML.JS2a]UXY12349.1 LysR family transcriptional regulator [Kosakonia sp. ML.JS2a]